ncbi:MAG: hypothetical protein HYS13_18755 [Planctomycetia bacterium]|nr:hypothetical protein [Planctomycetia bacterium]
MSLRFSLLGLFALVTFAALAWGALVGSAKDPATAAAPWWWASGVATGTVLLWMVCLFGALFGAGRRRAACGGALLAGAIYWLIVFSPFFRDGVGSKLITSRLIRLVEMKTLVEGNPTTPNNPVVTSFIPTPMTDSTVPLNYTGDPLITGNLLTDGTRNLLTDGTSSTLLLGTTIYVSSPAPPPVEAAHLATPLQEVAHYLLIWPLALAGGVLAGCMYALARRRGTAKT